MSLDGFIAPEGMDMAHANDPEYKQWMKKWMELMNWVSQQQFFRENLNLGEGGEIGQRTSVSVMGKNMFGGGSASGPRRLPSIPPSLS
jgi:hypothetical protein